jgi:putative phosphoribosyl transferase
VTSIREAAVYDVEIPAASGSGAAASLPGRLVLPEGAAGLVLFAHGSGSGRSSPRNTFVASVLHEAWLGTLLFDLLTPQEAADRARVFDIRLLADRLHAAIRFIASHEPTRGLRLGLFGASTGAAAALVAAAEEPAVKAVVSRGGRPDLAGVALRRVHVPTLLIVGSEDIDVLQLNEQSLEALGGEKQLAIIPGASHLFEEPGTLEEAARLAAEWCVRHLGSKIISGGRQ